MPRDLETTSARPRQRAEMRPRDRSTSSPGRGAGRNLLQELVRSDVADPAMGELLNQIHEELIEARRRAQALLPPEGMITVVRPDGSYSVTVAAENMNPTPTELKMQLAQARREVSELATLLAYYVAPEGHAVINLAGGLLRAAVPERLARSLAATAGVAFDLPAGLDLLHLADARACAGKLAEAMSADDPEAAFEGWRRDMGDAEKRRAWIAADLARKHAETEALERRSALKIVKE